MSINQLILATLAYHDIFNYPLAEDEVHSFLIEKKVDIARIRDGLNSLMTRSIIGSYYGFYYLKNRAQISRTRLARENNSRQKFKRALFYGALLKAIPTIKLLAISGALAMNNSRKNDDIDLLIITSRGNLWTTRFLANFILWPFKRDPKGKSVSNKACLNLFLDETYLKINDQNLYTAHEICQIKPIWDRDNAYHKLIRANSWIKKYLPNWQPDNSIKYQVSSIKKSGFSLITSHLSLIEILLKKFQLWYMKSKISTERIGEGQLFFHPANTGEWVMGEFQKRLKILKISV